MIRQLDDNIMDSTADMRVVPVNCVAGVLGAGLAKKFADRYPGLPEMHRQAVLGNLLKPGTGFPVMMVQPPQMGVEPKHICFFLFPTKNHFKQNSRLEWVMWGLESMAGYLVDPASPIAGKIRTVAVPALGCGLGGLRWAHVRPLILRTAEAVTSVAPEISFDVYGPVK